MNRQMQGSQLYQSGRIVRLEDGIARIVFSPPAGCASCAGGGCGIVLLGAPGNSGCRVVQIDVRAQPDLAVGDPVRVGIDARRLLKLVCITYLSPLLGLLAGYAVLTALAPASGDLGAMSGVLAGGLLSTGLLLVSSGRRRSLGWLGASVTRLP